MDWDITSVASGLKPPRLSTLLASILDSSISVGCSMPAISSVRRGQDRPAWPALIWNIWRFLFWSWVLGEPCRHKQAYNATSRCSGEVLNVRCLAHTEAIVRACSAWRRKQQDLVLYGLLFDQQGNSLVYFIFNHQWSSSYIICQVAKLVVDDNACPRIRDE